MTKHDGIWKYYDVPISIPINTLIRRWKTDEGRYATSMLYLSWEDEPTHNNPHYRVSYNENINDSASTDQSYKCATYTDALAKISELTGLTDREYAKIESPFDSYFTHG